MSDIPIFVINLVRATDRWAAISADLEKLGLRHSQIEAIEGAALPDDVAGYDERGYRLRHGKRTHKNEIGCYFSHLQACRAFLETRAAHAIILEDDAVLADSFAAAVQASLGYASHWDLLRLGGVHSGMPLRVADIGSGYRLCVNLGRYTGAAGYMVNRRAAEAMLKHLLPMRLPYDHAFDREWLAGYRSLSLYPAVVTQRNVDSTIGYGSRLKLHPLKRYPTVVPFRACNESMRFLYRLGRWIALRSSIRN